MLPDLVHQQMGAGTRLDARAPQADAPPQLSPNPLSVYFCHRAGGELALVIYEVRNTFGDIHA